MYLGVSPRAASSMRTVAPTGPPTASVPGKSRPADALGAAGTTDASAGAATLGARRGGGEGGRAGVGRIAVGVAAAAVLGDTGAEEAEGRAEAASARGCCSMIEGRSPERR